MPTLKFANDIEITTCRKCGNFVAVEDATFPEGCFESAICTECSDE